MVSDDWYNVDTSPYPDVKADNMFAAYIAHCKEYGIVSPYPDGNFYPADPISREIMIKWLLAAVKVRDRLPDYLFVFPPRNAVIQDGYRDPVTSESVGTFTELAVFVKTKQPNSNALFAAVFYEAGQFKGVGIIPETLQNHISGVVYIPISGQPLSGSTTVKLYALDTNTLRPLSPPAVFDLMP